MSLRKVLFISYHFPPHGGPGVQRSLKFVKYLPDFGWQPWVITSQPSATIVSDSSQLEDIPYQLPIIRVPGFSIQELMAKTKPNPIHRFVVLLNLLLQVPDPGVFWARHAYRTITSLIGQIHPDVIYTTSGPYSTHLLGLWLKRSYDLPWLTDFRDPWSKNLVIPYLPGYRKLNKFLERQVLEHADKVACVSAPWLNDLFINLGKDKEKFTLIHNGFDEDDLRRSNSRFSPPFTITHLGSLYRDRNPRIVIQAIANLINSGAIQKGNIRLWLIGKDVRGNISSYPWISQIGYIPHAELEEYRSVTHMYLLILNCSPDNAGNYSGKIYEYMASNRPIMAIAPSNGVAKQLLLDSNTGFTVENDIQEIEKAILGLYREWKQGYPNWSPNWDVINQYTRRDLTEQLAQEFEQLANNRGQA